MNAYVWFEDPEWLRCSLVDGDDAVLPGAQWIVVQEPISVLAQRLREVLVAQPVEREEMSLRGWYALAGAEEVGQWERQTARDEALGGIDWHVEGQRVV